LLGLAHTFLRQGHPTPSSYSSPHSEAGPPAPSMGWRRQWPDSTPMSSPVS
jgi:hypothetical protein